ncbi:MAG: TrkH family potassium uptake protein [Hyphomicrobiaceae bacterium]|nr:TrkH family potassium uptake protein [Hyphomicrobiaceae bacterium]
MLNLRPIFFAIGLMLAILSATMILPALVDLADANSDWRAFLAAAVFTFFVGGLLVLMTFDDRQIELSVKDAFLLTTLSWVMLCAFAALPFIGVGISYTDAFFETMSGLTTTGSTVLTGLDSLPRGVLLWRALLNGIGGIGIIVMALLILPYLRVGGMQLFRAESSDKSEKIVPRALELVSATAGVYVGLLVLCAVVYALLGMSIFDAICHSMATLATGGFSTHDLSFKFFQSPAIEWSGTFFMALGALPFVVLIQAMSGGPRALWRDEQVRGFIGFLIVVTLILAMWYSMTRGVPLTDAVRLSAFNVTSIVTTTGFVSDDYTQWGTFAIGLFFLLTFVGGCSGSTAGAIKIYRLQVAGLLTRRHFTHLISPNRIVTLSYNGRRLPDDVPFSVVAFLAIYMATVGIFTVLLTGMGLDLTTSLSSAAQALGNVGPGFGDIVGPSGNFATLPAPAKWVLALAMLLGRLELFTVLVLFRPEFWRS